MQVENWTYHNILDLVNQSVQENIHLDYKQSTALQGSDSKKDEIAKDVSAFANSDGGTIIYGVAEENHIPARIDGGIDFELFSKEWIENVVTSRISPRISNLKIFPIHIPDSSPARYILVLSIPKSESAPHMSSDKRYYKRHNFKSMPMEHYEIEDIRNRFRHPNLKISASIISPVVVLNEDSLQIRFFLTITNFSETLAEYYSIEVLVKNDFIVECADLNREEGEMFIDGVALARYHKNFGIPSSMPIWKGANFRALDLRVNIPSQYFGSSVPIVFSINQSGRGKTYIYHRFIIQRDLPPVMFKLAGPDEN
jgi:hypothetical protein